jgi:hypothetical protein
MKIVTKEDAVGLLKGQALDAVISQLSTELPLVRGAYAAPVSSQQHIALSRFFADLLIRDPPVCVYITGWSVADEHFDLFYGYRRSLGEMRPLIDAPVHVFERTDEDALISVLCLVLFFLWDAWIFDLTENWLLRLTHDGWLEVRAGHELAAKNVATELESYYKIPLLHG